ncbi:MAG: prefoldin subunit [Candidatus Aenigmatarchaeota archaeon]
MVNENVLQEYQKLQEQYRIIVIQKEGLKLQIGEIEHALKELENSKEDFAYRIFGDIMVKKRKEEIVKELQEEMEDFKIRINNLEKMEKFMEERIKEMEERIKKGE